MTRPTAGRASIQIVGDLSKFSAQVTADANAALAGVRVDAAPLGAKVGKTFETGVTEALKAAKPAIAAAAAADGRAIADALGVESGFGAAVLKNVEAAAAQLRGGVGKLQAAGAKLGQAATKGLDVALKPLRALADYYSIGAAKGLAAGTPEMEAAGNELGDAAARGISKPAESEAAGLRNATAAARGTAAGVPEAAAAGNEVGNATAKGVATSEPAAAEAGGLLGRTVAKYAKMAALGVIAGLVAVTAAGLKSAASLEQTQISLNALTGSVANGTKAFKDLQNFANVTPFTFPQVADSAKRFLALSHSVGMTQADLIPFLTTMGNLASVTGVGAEGMNRASLALAQMSSVGRVTQGDLNQLANAFPGFNAVQAIAAARGETTAQTMKAIQKGTIPASEGIRELLAGMNKFPGAAGAMEAQSKTLLGVFSTFSDVVRANLTNSFKPVIPAVKESLVGITPLIGQSLGQLAPSLGKVLAQLLPLLSNILAAITPILAPLLDAFAPAIGIIAKSLVPLGQAFGRIATAVAPLIPLLATIIDAFVKAFTPIINAFVPLFEQIAPVLIAIFQPIIPLISTLGQLFAVALMPVLDAFADVFKTLGPILEPVMRELGEAIVPLLKAFMAIMQALGPVIPPLINALMQAFLPLVDMLATVLPQIAPLLPPLFGAIADAVTALTPVISEIAQVLVQALGPILGVLPQIVKMVSQAIQALLPVIVAMAPAFLQILQALAPLIPTLVTALVPILQLALDVIVQLAPILTELATIFGDMLATAIKDLMPIVTTLIGYFVHLFEVVGHIAETIIGYFGKLIKYFQTNLLPIWKSIFGTIAGFISGIADVVTTVFGGIADVVQGAFEGAVGIIEGIINGVIGAFNFIIHGLNDAIDIANDLNPFSDIPHIPDIPKLARGGFSLDQMVAQLHPSELVLPLEDTRVTNLLTKALTAAQQQVPAQRGPAEPSNVDVKVFIGDTELKGIVDVQIDESNRGLRRRVLSGAGGY